VSGGWERLDADWHQLWRELQEPTPFQSYAWLTACFNAFSEEHPRVLLAHAPDRVVGILPLSGGEVVRLAGGGVSDYQDALAAPGFERMVMGAIVEHFLEHRHRWSELHFENLRPESALLFGDFGENHTDLIEAHEVCPTLDLSGPPAVRSRLPQAIPAHQREKVRYYLRRAQKLGKLEFESVTFETLNEFLEALFQLHQARWRVRGQSGVLDADAVKSFHRIAAPGLLRAEVLRMYAMRLNGKIVAMYLGFLSGKRAYYYLSGFDPEAQELSPGTALIGHAIEEAVREGATTFDFLRGGEPYKYAWGAHDTHTYCRKIVRL
jgi:CelD/BcsL family acetyltransferase involved in cellulose biosynthesis